MNNIFTGGYLITEVVGYTYSKKFGVVDFCIEKGQTRYVCPGHKYVRTVFMGRIQLDSVSGKTQADWIEDTCLFRSSETSSTPYVELSPGTLVLGDDFPPTFQRNPRGSGFLSWSLGNQTRADEFLSQSDQGDFVTPRHLKYGDLGQILGVNPYCWDWLGDEATSVYLMPEFWHEVYYRQVVNCHTRTGRPFASVNCCVIARPEGLFILRTDDNSKTEVKGYLASGAHDVLDMSDRCVWLPGASVDS